jgi:hypothetical protein
LAVAVQVAQLRTIQLSEAIAYFLLSLQQVAVQERFQFLQQQVVQALVVLLGVHLEVQEQLQAAQETLHQLHRAKEMMVASVQTQVQLIAAAVVVVEQARLVATAELLKAEMAAQD